MFANFRSLAAASAIAAACLTGTSAEAGAGTIIGLVDARPL